MAYPWKRRGEPVSPDQCSLQGSLSSRMNDMTSIALRSAGLSIPSREYGETRWYAAHTGANHEKRVAQQLHLRDQEFSLPLYDTVRRRKDPRMRMQFPLFPGAISVHMPLGHQLRICQGAGVD